MVGHIRPLSPRPDAPSPGHRRHPRGSRPTHRDRAPPADGQRVRARRAPVRVLAEVAVATVVAHVAGAPPSSMRGASSRARTTPTDPDLSFLVAQGSDLIGRFWLPGAGLTAMAFVQRLRRAGRLGRRGRGDARRGRPDRRARRRRALARAQDLRPLRPEPRPAARRGLSAHVVLDHSSLAEALGTHAAHGRRREDPLAGSRLVQAPARPECDRACRGDLDPLRGLSRRARAAVGVLYLVQRPRRSRRAHRGMDAVMVAAPRAQARSRGSPARRWSRKRVASAHQSDRHHGPPRSRANRRAFMSR